MSKPDNFSHAREMLVNDGNKHMLYLFDALFVDLSSKGLMETTDCYQLATYCRLTFQLNALLRDYNPANPNVTETRYTQKGTEYEITFLDPRHKVYIDLLDQQSALAVTLGVDPKARGKLLKDIKQAEAMSISCELAQERMRHNRLEARERIEYQKTRQKESHAKLQLLQNRMSVAARQAESRIALAEQRHEDANALNAELLELKKTMVDLRKEALELRKREIELRDEREKEKLKPPSPSTNIENPVRRLMTSSAGRKKQLALKAPKK